MSMDTKIESKNGIKKHHVIIAVVVLVVAALIYYTFGMEHLSTFRTERGKLSFGTVEQQEFKDYIRQISNVEPISIVYLDAIEGGRVEEKVIEEGSMVKKGDIILRLSNPDLNLSILNSQANLAEQENFLRNTMVTLEQQRIANKQQLISTEYDVIRKRRTFHQNEKLFSEGLVSEEDFTVSNEDFEMAKKQYALKQEQYCQDSIYRSIQVDRMSQNLSNMQRNLDLVHNRVESLNVKAPVDGQLGFLDAEIGQSIGRGTRIGQINVLTDYKIVAQIDEHYIERVKRNLMASFTREDVTYELRVKKVYPEVRDGRFKVDMVFTGERPQNIRSGQTYHTQLQLGESNEALLIPRGSFFQTTGGQWIFVVDPSGSFASKREIRIGRQNPNFYEVLEGLEPGEEVVVSGYERFGDNEIIEF